MNNHLEVTDLMAENARLRAALEPFAKMANFCHPRHRDARPFIFGFDTAIAQRLTVGDLRRAAEAISPADRKGEA
jgi:hypothetical protein